MNRHTDLPVPFLIATAAFFCGLFAGASAQSVLVVDDTAGSGAPYSTIQSAVIAAAPGDIVLIKPGTYPPFTIDGKGITVCYDTSAGAASQMVISGSVPIVVRNVPSGQTVTFQNITVRHGRGVRCESNQGTLWFDRCDITASADYSVPQLECVQCADLVISSSTLNASVKLTNIGTLPAPVLRIVDGSTRVAILGSQVRGNWFASKYIPGCDAANLICERFFASATTFAGGKGGPNYGIGMPGGDGLVIGTQNGATLLNCALFGGQGGGTCIPLADCGISGSPPLGPTGKALIVAGGTFTQLSGPSESVQMPSPIREAQSVTFSVSCGSGDLAWVLVAAAPAPMLTIPGIVGPLILDPTSTALLPTALPIGCTGAPVSFSIPAPTLPAPVLGKDLFVQGVFIDALLSRIRVSTAAALVILDSAY
ncbi:MAG: hypothetical protein JNJ88_05565 [Planctomycetes bacterium]|nr:hypothetical protein [Planctomycetota bacterium]